MCRDHHLQGIGLEEGLGRSVKGADLLLKEVEVLFGSPELLLDAR